MLSLLISSGGEVRLKTTSLSLRLVYSLWQKVIQTQIYYFEFVKHNKNIDTTNIWSK